MSLKLSELLKYDDIVIQCHDNPDADALASGFALSWYFNKMGKDTRFVYGGRFPVQKSNLVLMVENLGIKVTHVHELERPQLLVMVDCQYGESNAAKFAADNIAVIDHHQVSGELPEMSEVRSAYGSCSTLMMELLKDEKIDINEDENIATALYYGLMTDTNNFTEISHPADKDLRDIAQFSNADVILFRNSNLSRGELHIAGDALNSASYNDEYSYAIVEAQPCDPNILGIISDMLLEVDTVLTCLVYSILPFGVKISVRSCIKDVKASELADYIADGIGGGGGHLVKAGGFLKKDLIEKMGVEYESDSIRKLLSKRMKTYFETSEIIEAGKYEEDVALLKHYKKKEVHVGYVDALDVAESGTTVMIRTLEGDIDVPINDDLYILIGIEGEIYPVSKKRFASAYKVTDEEYVFPGEYSPAVVDCVTGEKFELLSHVHSCIALGGDGIYARELDHRVKVFTRWDDDKYYLGLPGDFLAVRTNDLSDVYVINRDIFFKTYDEAPI